MNLGELYREQILDHARHPRNAALRSDDVVLVDEENPMCGDRIRLTATVEDGRVTDVRFEANGCAISVASASMMSERVRGRPVAEVRELCAEVIRGLRGEADMDETEFGEVAALAGVSRFPMRVKCGTMGWHALRNAIEKLMPDSPG